MLMPVRRIHLPPEILRGLFRSRHPSQTVIDPVEPNGPRLDAANDLMNALNMNLWASAWAYGETIHVLDAMESAHVPFIQTDFPPGSFIPWEQRRVPLYETENGPIYSNNESDTPTFYHYWQIFWLAAILRSGLHTYFPLDDKELERELLDGTISNHALRERTHRTLNCEAYDELCTLRSFECHFEVVGYYKAYTHNAFQLHGRNHDEHGRIPHRDWQQYLRREREIARDALAASGLSQSDIIAFIGQQCGWWKHARRAGPLAVAEEYKRNINISIGFLRDATGIDPRHIVEQVGRRTGHHRPTLEVIFPDWTEEQRDLTIRSLQQWTNDDLAGLPAPFPYTEAELKRFLRLARRQRSLSVLLALSAANGPGKER